MADVVVSSNELKIEMYFVDGDTRNITLKNPADSTGSEEIQSLQAYMQANQPLVGDKLGAAFGKISKATKIQTESEYIDIDH